MRYYISDGNLISHAQMLYWHFYSGKDESEQGMQKSIAHPSVIKLLFMWDQGVKMLSKLWF